MDPLASMHPLVRRFCGVFHGERLQDPSESGPDHMVERKRPISVNIKVPSRVFPTVRCGLFPVHLASHRIAKMTWERVIGNPKSHYIPHPAQFRSPTVPFKCRAPVVKRAEVRRMGRGTPHRCLPIPTSSPMQPQSSVCFDTWHLGSENRYTFS